MSFTSGPESHDNVRVKRKPVSWWQKSWQPSSPQAPGRRPSDQTAMVRREFLTKAELGLLAGIANFGLLIFNVGFTNADVVAALNPDMFSTFGQLMILVWGAAFMAAGLTDAQPALWGVFALEKLCYTAGYVVHRMRSKHNSIRMAWDEAVLVYEQQQDRSDVRPLLAPVFHCVYGPVDAVFMLMFLYTALTGKAAARQKKN